MQIYDYICIIKSQLQNTVMQEENIAIRLKVFIDETGLTLSQFADQCGIARPSLSQILSGRNKKISDVLIGQIHAGFPELSVMWLLFGEGEMYSHPGKAAAVESDEREIESVELKMGVENPVNAGNLSDESKFSNVRGLNNSCDRAQTVVNNGINYENRCLELQRELDRYRKNPRKVAQITVYYDDSTFETFYPEK